MARDQTGGRELRQPFRVEIDHPQIFAVGPAAVFDVGNHLPQRFASEGVVEKQYDWLPGNYITGGIHREDLVMDRRPGVPGAAQVTPGGLRQRGGKFHTGQPGEARFRREEERAAFAAAEIHETRGPCRGWQRAQQGASDARVGALILHRVLPRGGGRVSRPGFARQGGFGAVPQIEHHLGREISGRVPPAVLTDSGRGQTRVLGEIGWHGE